jgi:glyoxylase-like metal-dependent hydrolase (beta-lactamase superfamily II)
MLVGDIEVIGVSDGTFLARPRYFGAAVPDDARPDFFDRDGAAWLPIGCFVIRVDERVLLVDAGLGPEIQHLPDGMLLVGGQLLTGLRALGIDPATVTDVICTHLHSDHVGWLFDADANPVFTTATIWYGAADWDYYRASDEMARCVRAGFGNTEASRLHALHEDTPITRGVAAILTPGHTPGSLSVEVRSGGDRMLVIGDAITCPIQLAEPTWHSFGDVDAALADRTRRRLWDELADGRTIGVGAHFPQLAAGRVNAGKWTEPGGSHAR